MNAGRELDALVAEKVMGLPRALVDAMALGPRYYSTDIAAAWVVIGHLLHQGYRHPLVRYDSDRSPGKPRWTAAISSPDGKSGARGDAATAPAAICLAALRAVGVEVPA